jgi:hypothetical protein
MDPLCSQPPLWFEDRHSRFITGTFNANDPTHPLPLPSQACARTASAKRSG